MGKFKIGSSGISSVIPEIESVVEYQDLSSPMVVDIPKPIIKEYEVVVELPKPVLKEISVEIPKPVYVINEVEHSIEKPKYIVEEMHHTVIRPVFNVKQELQSLDQLQDKIDESVAIAKEKLDVLNMKLIMSQAESVEILKEQSKKLKFVVYALALSNVLATIALLLR